MNICYALHTPPFVEHPLSSTFNFFFETPKDAPPGPIGLPVLGSYLEFKEHHYELLPFLSALFDRYGKEAGIFQFKMGSQVFVCVTHPKYIKAIYQNPSAFIRGDGVLKAWEEKFSPGGLREGEQTMHFRGQAQRAVGEKQTHHYFEGMVKTSQAWIQKLQTQKSIDLFNETERVSLAIMGEAFFTNDEGKNPFSLDSENDERCTQFLNEFHKVFDLLSARMTSGIEKIPYIGDLFYRLWYSNEDQEFAQAKQTLMNILEPLFKTLLEGEIKEGSHLHMLLEIFEIDPKNPNYGKLIVNSLGFLQASFETASKATAWCLNHLSQDQKLQSELRALLFEAYQDHFPENKEELENVPLLTQVILETLRLFSPFPVLVRDAVNPEKFPEYVIPKGANMLIAPFLVHRDSKNWDNPTIFDPSRFTEEMQTDNWQKRHPEFAAFLGGKHRCVGRFFAMEQIRLILINFLMHFRIKRESAPLEYTFNITLQPKEPIIAELHKLCGNRVVK